MNDNEIIEQLEEREDYELRIADAVAERQISPEFVSEEDEGKE